MYSKVYMTASQKNNCKSRNFNTFRAIQKVFSHIFQSLCPLSYIYFLTRHHFYNLTLTITEIFLVSDPEFYNTGSMGKKRIHRKNSYEKADSVHDDIFNYIKKKACSIFVDKHACNRLW